MATLVQLLQDDRGQDLAEYGMALAIIAGFVVLIAIFISTQVDSLWASAQGPINSAAS